MERITAAVASCWEEAPQFLCCKPGFLTLHFTYRESGVRESGIGREIEFIFLLLSIVHYNAGSNMSSTVCLRQSYFTFGATTLYNQQSHGDTFPPIINSSCFWHRISVPSPLSRLSPFILLPALIQISHSADRWSNMLPSDLPCSLHYHLPRVGDLSQSLPHSSPAPQTRSLICMRITQPNVWWELVLF